MINSRILKPRLTLQHLWMAAPFFVIVMRGFRAPLPLLDFWWHLKMGEIIVTTHSIPRADLLSFTAAGKPFIVQNWLAEVLYYQIYQLGGLPLLVLLNTFLLAAALLPVFLLCRESTDRMRLAALATLLTCVAFSANARPQVFSLVLFALFYWILDGYRFHRRDQLWLLPVAMIVWVNLHGAFVVGLALIGIFLASQGLLRLFNPTRKDSLSNKQFKKLALVFAATLGATLLNPETWKVYDYVRVVASDQASQQLVMEWQPPRINSPIGIQMFFGLFGIAVAGLICTRRRPNLTDLALFLAFSIFGLTALRNTIWFAVIIAPILVRYWNEIELAGSLQPLKRFRFLNPPSRSEEMGTYQEKPSFVLNGILVFVALGAIVGSSPWVRRAHDPAGLLEPQTPAGAADYIARHGIREHIFHPQIFGDYLVWRLYPQQHSFIDGRVHLFGETFVREYQKTFYDSHWEANLAQFDIQYLLLSKDAEQADSTAMIQKARASANWAVLFEDNTSILFMRKKA